MARLEIGEKIALQTGGYVTILSELGEGGQGYVYKVSDESSNEYALKWYKNSDEWMYDNISKLISIGSPSDDFLWPLMLTQKKNDVFGYLMHVRPKEFKDIIKGRFVVDFNKFSSPIVTKLNVAIKICDALKKIHAIGLVFYDLNDGGFFINPENGDVLICDCDNVSPQGASNMGGMMRFKAPEIVVGKAGASKQTDYFSLSVVLFMLLYGNHPFEGAKAVSYPCTTEKVEKEIYGENAIFICDPTNDGNRPVKNVHTNVLTWWEFYPKSLNKAFEESFSSVAIMQPNTRFRESKWQSIFSRIRDLIIVCECGEEIFPSKNGCYFCKKGIHIQHALLVKDKKIPLFHGKVIYANSFDSTKDFFEEIGKVVVNKKTKAFGIRNISTNGDWSIIISGKVSIIKPNNVCLIEKDAEISFPGNNSVKVI
jgi:serine/threonine protein kinase